MPATTRRRAATNTATKPEPDDAGSSDVEQHLRTALRGVTKLRRRFEDLTQENTRLKEELDRLYEAQDVSIQPKRGKKGNVSVLSLTAQVNKLRREVAGLEDARKRDRKRIRKLQLKEVKMDAMELGGELEYGVQDESTDMKRLLRRFFELVSAPSMEDKEECAVCLTEMNLSSARSLPCGHIFCSECIPNINPQNCPSCRKPFESLEDTEPVTFTATEQWDALLEVAAEWGRIDKGESPVDTEEESLPFIEDDQQSRISTEDTSMNGADEDNMHENGDATTTTPSRRVRRLDLSTPPPDRGTSPFLQQDSQNSPSTPTPISPSPASYQSSPVSVKRRRMKELAEARLAKRVRK